MARFSDVTDWTDLTDPASPEGSAVASGARTEPMTRDAWLSSFLFPLSSFLFPLSSFIFPSASRVISCNECSSSGSFPHHGGACEAASCAALSAVAHRAEEKGTLHAASAAYHVPQARFILLSAPHRSFARPAVFRLRQAETCNLQLETCDFFSYFT